MPSRRVYDLLYRTGAARWRRGWEVGVGPEVAALMERSLITPASVGGPRAVDLGCGVGTNAVYLAKQGFDVTGVDFSPAAIAQAERTAAAAGVEASFLVADVTRPIAALEIPVDLVLLYNVLQDLDDVGRRGLAAETTRLSRPGTTVLLWCWYGSRKDLPLVSYKGPSRIAPFVVEPGEEQDLFGSDFSLERLPFEPGSRRAVFLLRAR